jgi:glycosyltransferase involved in cell wall biosynthesis
LKSKTVLVDLLAYTEQKGGTDFYIKNLYRNISNLEHNLNFVGFACKESKTLDMTWFPGEIFYTKLSGENKLQWSAGELFGLPRFARKIKPELIHCPANFGPRKTSAPALLTVHDSLYWSSPQWAPNRLLVPGVRFMQKSAIRNSSAIITSSHASAKEISSLHKVNLSDISVIYLAAIENKFNSVPSSDNSPYILAGGNRFRHKNWEGLLLALMLIDPKIRPKTIITGGRSPDPLIPIIRDFQLERDVSLLNWVSDYEMNQLYSNASAVIIPSYTESYLPLFQAIRFEKSLLISAIPPHIEIAGENAYYFNPASPKSIADAIQLYLDESIHQSKRVRVNLAQSDEYSWQKTALQTLKIMEAIVDSDM